MQKKERSELPPIFTTERFTSNIAYDLNNIEDRKEGYDQIEYRTTRYNNVPRTLSIIHPKPYSQLATILAQNWEEIEYICKNGVSIVIPKKHKDGRLIIMDYNASWENNRRCIKKSFSKKFTAHADISNFYPSIYTHAIPWAIVGHGAAKKNKSKNDLWYNRVDHFAQATKRKETHGVAVGPATSNILAEIILAKIDKELSGKYDYVRYIDDYTGFCETHDEAETFIQDLSKYLSSYNLSLNAKKISINKLPTPVMSEWVTLLNFQIPKADNIRWSQAVYFLDYAIKLGKEFDGSVVKYAVKAISKKIDRRDAPQFVEHLFNICQHHPIVIPLVNDTLSLVLKKRSIDYHAELNHLLNVSILNSRSDAMSWLLYYLFRYDVAIDNKLLEKIIETNDCISILMLSLLGNYKDFGVEYCQSIIKNKNPYDIDKYWLLMYQLFYDGKIGNPYEEQCDKKTFKRLKEKRVSFLYLK